MIYQIKFVTGENTGACYKIKDNQSLAIGRSHSNDICLKSPDISGRHVMIRTGRGSITIEILSSRITKYNDRQVNLGDMIEPCNGDKIQMGNDTAFVVEVMDEMNSISNICDDDATVIPEENVSQDEQNTVQEICPNELNGSPISAVSATDGKIGQDDKSESATENKFFHETSESNETIAFQTRIASDEELDEIKKAFKRKHYKKMLMIALPIAIFFAVAIALYVYIKPTTEEFLSWPQDKNGKDLDDFQQIAPYLALCYPKVSGCQIKKDGAIINIVTKIGKLQDVPLYISATSKADVTNLKVDHQQAFDIWCDQMRDKEQSINFNADKITVFLNTHRGAGVPVSYLSYSRRKGNDDYWGYAVFVRKAETIHTILFDVPFTEKWRAEKFFKRHIGNMVIYAVRRTADHWEGTAAYRNYTAVEQDLQEVETFMSREAPVYWGRIFYLLRSALIKATLNKNKGQIEQAQKILTDLREQQAIWFSTQKLAYQYAERNNDKQAMRSIQAMCESVFSAEFQFADFRYDLIKRKDWK